MKEILKDLQTLTGFSEQDIKTLQQFAPTTQKWTDQVTKIFYDTLFSYEPTSQVFKEGERPDREVTLKNWYIGVTSGDIDDNFWRRQWFVGLMHIKRHVSNSFMLGMVSRVQQVFLEKCMQELKQDDALKLYGAFKRVFDVVAGLIAEGYFVNYMESLEHVLGFNKALIERMMNIEIDRMIERARANINTNSA